MANTSTRVLGRLPAPDAPPFALLRREREPGVELLLGDLVDIERLADLPLPQRRPAERHDLLALVPFRHCPTRPPPAPAMTCWSPGRAPASPAPSSTWSRC